MAPNRDAYHHGNLREALLEAGLELTRAGGPAALVLRDVTRRVGVSPNAAYRHFADRDDLQRAVAERIQEQMAVLMAGSCGGPSAGRVTGDRAYRELRAVGLGYIDFAVREPGWFEVAFGGSAFADAVLREHPVDDPQLDGDPGGRLHLAAASGSVPAPMVRLIAALDGLVAAGVLDARHRPGAEWPCWSAVHGFAVLALHGPLRGRPPEAIRAAAERTVDAVITGLIAAGAPAAG